MMKKIGCCILILLCCACSAEPDRDVEGSQEDEDTTAQLGTALEELEAADNSHLRQENEGSQLVDPSIRKPGSTEDTTAKPNDVYAPYEFSGAYTDKKGASFHVEQTEQSGLMAQVNVTGTGLLPQGSNTTRWDKQTFEQALENVALGDYVRACEMDDDQLHTCKVGEFTVTFGTDVDGYPIYHRNSRDRVMRVCTNIHKEEVHLMSKI